MSARSRRLWTETVSTWRFDPVALAALHEALRELDAADAAAATLDVEGTVIVNPRSGVQKPHPLVGVRATHLSAFRQLMAALKLQPPV